MRKTIVIFVLFASLTAIFTSCTTYRGADRNGCKSTQGYIGYGSR